MKKLLAFLLLCTTGLWAQVTVPPVVDFDFPSGPGVQMAYVPDGYSAYKSSTTTLYPERMIKPDSLPAQRWTYTLTRFISTGIFEARVEGSLIASPNVRLSYLDTLNVTTSTVIQIPDRTVQIVNNGGSMTQIVPYQNTWRVAFKTTGMQVGDVVEWLFTRSVPIQALSNGTTVSSSLPSLDSLTIADNDSFRVVNSDTVYTAAIPGRFGFVTLFLTAYGATSDTIPTFGLAYQVKETNGEWASSAEYYSLTATSVLDSLAIPHGATRYVWPTTTPADSLRFRIIGKTVAGRAVMNKVVARWRD